MQISNKPIVLIILDGWGYSENTKHNAIQTANKPVWNRLWQEYPHTLINASGTSVGLPDMQMGNSEVGHMNIGSGRIISQDFTRINNSIIDGSFFKNTTLTNACKIAAGADKAVHIMGLLSNGGVHSHQDQIFALVELTDKTNVKKIYLHAFLDGRDTPPKSAEQFLRDTEGKLAKIGRGQIASITGRYYAMDRNNNWDRIQAVYNLICQGKSDYHSKDSSLSALSDAYARGETDEFVKPTAIVANGESPVAVSNGDVIIFANFRADRARQLSMAFTEETFNRFHREVIPQLGAFISMTEYKAEFDFPCVFPSEQHRNVLGEYLSELGLHQLRIAETEKYAHVTFFFNGGEETIFKDEDRILVASPEVATYDLKPQMSAYEVTDKLIDAINSQKYDAIICNFANADMVGHTGDFEASILAIEALDECLGKIVPITLAIGGELLITSDHGNAELMYSDENGETHTAHTNNLVPFLYIGRSADASPGQGALCDITPTILYLMGLEQPDEMTGSSLMNLYEQIQQPKASD